jgi:hypothetical protein
MKGRRIRVDWDDLEGAFSNRDDELVYYLDTVTGHVHLEGEGDDDDFDEDDPTSEPVAPRADRADDSTRAYVARPDSKTELEWMRAFVDEVEDGEAGRRERLRATLDSDDPFHAFRDALMQDAEGRDAWFLFRSDRIHESIDAWLAANEIIPTAPPPWG